MGAPNHPQWFHNLVANPDVTVELGDDHFAARARVVEGDERAALWSRVIDDKPFLGQHQESRRPRHPADPTGARMTTYNEGQRSMQDRFDTRRLADRLDEVTYHQTFWDGDRTFIEGAVMFFLATADADGQPDVSYKGGMPGFVRVVDERTLAFPSYDGNGQFRSLGNILVNPHVSCCSSTSSTRTACASPARRRCRRAPPRPTRSSSSPSIRSCRTALATSTR